MSDETMQLLIVCVAIVAWLWIINRNPGRPLGSDDIENEDENDSVV